MANTSRLNPEILKFLSENLIKKVTTIGPQISVLKRSYPYATLNAVAQVYAKKHDLSVLRYLSKEDKATIPQVEFVNAPIRKVKRSKSSQRDKIVFLLESEDNFFKKHVKEMNRAYSRGCYTSVILLARKMFENLLIEILRLRFRAEPDLYYDKDRGRFHDFKDILKNLYTHRIDFGPVKKKAIETLYTKLELFRKDANNKAHSIFHIVEGQKDIDSWHLDTIVDLILKIKEGL